MANHPVEELATYRTYLLAVTRIHLGPGSRMNGVFDASDIVQKTLLTAQERIDQYRGTTSNELCTWLKIILVHKIIDEVRRYDNRPDRQLVSIEQSIDDSSNLLESLAASALPSPISVVLLNERISRLSAVLAELPEDQRVVIESYYFHGLKVGDIASKMGRTARSISGLLRRGLERLRESMGDSTEEHR